MKKKIIISLAFMCLLTVVQGVIANVIVSKIRSQSNSVNAANTMTTDIRDTEMRHYIWLQDLSMTVFNEEEFSGNLDHETCSLGNLLNKESVKNYPDSQFQNLIAQIYDPHKALHQSAREILSLLDNGDVEGAEYLFNNSIVPSIDKTVGYLDDVFDYSETVMEKENKLIETTMLISTIVLIGIMVLSLVCGIIITSILTKKIVPPLKKLTSAAKEIALGDVTPDCCVKSNDELGELSAAFEEMVKGFREQSETLHQMAICNYDVNIKIRSEKDLVGQAISEILEESNRMMHEIRAASDQVATGSVQIADGAQMLATGSTEQAATLQEFSATISHIESQARENYELARKTLEDSKHAGTIMDESLEYMQQLTNAMEAINESSQNIAKVINVIDNIAFQTNILALNAAVEAARAGQHGKGFAVVAEEVRNLASKSAEAAKETAALIQSSVGNVEKGNEIAAKTGESLAQVGEISANNVIVMGELSQSSETQSSSIEEVNQGIQQISQVVQANSATAEESAASAQEMSAQSSLLAEIVGRFTLRNNVIQNSKAKHNVAKLPQSSSVNQLNNDVIF